MAAKQGWMRCIDGRTVVLLGDFPASTGWARAKGALDAAAAAIAER